jgi:ribosomal protein S21
MAFVVKQNNEQPERLISRFRQRVLKKGVLKQTRRTRYFVKAKSKIDLRKNAILRERKRRESAGILDN